MEVLKIGTVKELEREETCYKCNSELRYVPADVKLDRDSHYIECPVCRAFITVGEPSTYRMDG